MPQQKWLTHIAQDVCADDADLSIVFTVQCQGLTEKAKQDRLQTLLVLLEPLIFLLQECAGARGASWWSECPYQLCWGATHCRGLQLAVGLHCRLTRGRVVDVPRSDRELLLVRICTSTQAGGCLDSP